MSSGRRYRVHEVVGQGGFGSVYRAELLGEGGFSKPIALKILHGEMAAVEEVSQRLRDEARMLGRVRHRAIVGVDSLTLLNERWTIVMEYIHGIDLKRALSSEVLRPFVALQIVGEVASALHACFVAPDDAGVPLCLLHRDIKPSNVLVTTAGEVKVVDFGIAKADFGQREAQTRSLLFGSDLYMAPERFDLIDGPQGDIYSLGVTFYELLTGQPFGRSSPKESRHLERIDKARICLGQCLSQAEIGQIWPLLRSMVAYEPAERPGAREVEREALRILRGMEGELLLDWAERRVPGLLQLRTRMPDTGDLSGSVLVERTGATDVAVTAAVSEEGQSGSAEAYSDPTIGLPFPQPSRPPSARPVVASRPNRVGGWLVGGLALGVFTTMGLLIAAAALVWVGTELGKGPVNPPSAPSVAVPMAAESAVPPTDAAAPPLEDVVSQAPPKRRNDSSPAPARQTPPSEKPGPAVTARSASGPTPASPAPPAPVVSVTITGDAQEVRLVGDTVIPVPGRVPVGAYAVQARFQGEEWVVAGSVNVEEGARIQLDCQALFSRCVQ